MPTRALITRYRADLTLFPDVWHRAGLLAAAVLLVAFPFYASEHWQTIGNQTLIAVVASVSLMILTGFCGQISLGHAAFLALGAYTTSILGERLHIPFWLLVPLAGGLAAAVGLAVGVFALRLKGLYLAIVTIGLLYLVNHVLHSFPDYTHAGSGMDVPIYVWFGQSYESMEDIRASMDYGPITLTFTQKLYFIFLLIALLVVWMAKNLARSNAGRALMAVRDHDLAASSLGVNPARAKVLAFAVSSFLGGVAGAMYAMQQETISIEPFNLDMSVVYIAMIVLGGIGSVFGAVAGAIGFMVLAPMVESLGPRLPLIDRLSSAQQSTLLFSVLVIAFLIVEPLGLSGLWMRLKRYFAAWPFRY